MLKMTVYNIVRFLSYIMLGIIFIIGVNIYLVYHTGTPAYITKDIEMYTTSEMDVVKCNLKAGDTIFVLYDDFDAMMGDLNSAGHDYEILSCYRSKEDQENEFIVQVQKYIDKNK